MFFQDLSNFKVLKPLGSGAFGKAYLVIDTQSSLKFVAKVSSNMKHKEDPNNDFIQEIMTYSKTENPSVLPIYGFCFQNFDNKPYPTILLEYMKNGDLDTILKKIPKNTRLSNEYTATKRYITLLGVALGMKYLHSLGIIHRDLKPGNILLDDNYYPRICDFGISYICKFKTGHVSNYEYFFCWDYHVLNPRIQFPQIKMDDIVGTPLYQAPEIYDDEGYNYKVDVYSFSLIAYELLTGIRPFKDYTNKYRLIRDVKKGERPDLSSIQDYEIRSFINKCWSKSPYDRPDFNEIVKEINSDKYKKFFNVDENEVKEYLKYIRNNLSNEDLSFRINLKKAADEGNVNSMYLYGLLLKFYKRNKPFQEEANKYLQKALIKGSTNAIFL